MDLRQLDSFRAVVREGSFTAAARALHMTQPAVSLHIKALEESLGARILERDGKGVSLTPAGSVLLQAADAAFAALDDGHRRVKELVEPERGTVIVACGDTVALYLLPPVLTAFRAAHPHAEVVVRNHASRAVIEDVLRRDADVGIVTRPPYLAPELWVRTIHQEALVVALPKGHDLCKKASLRLQDLAGQSAVLLARPAETRALIDRALRTAGVELVPAMESGNLEVVKTYIAHGLGLGLLPELALTAADRERLQIRALPGTALRRKLAVVRRKDRPLGLLGTDLLRLLGLHLRQHLEHADEA